MLGGRRRFIDAIDIGACVSTRHSDSRGRVDQAVTLPWFEHCEICRPQFRYVLMPIADEALHVRRFVVAIGVYDNNVGRRS